VLLIACLEVTVERLAGLARHDDSSQADLALALDVIETFAIVLITIQGQQLRGARPRVQQHHENRLIPLRRLIGLAFQGTELLDGRFGAIDIDRRQPLPVGLVDLQLGQAFAGIAGELVNASKDRALILALHHPIYSAYGDHPGSQYLKTIVEEATGAANRVPDPLLTGHVHDYQRLNGSINGKPVTTIVAGAGSYNQKFHRLDRHLFDPECGSYKFEDGSETLEKFSDFQHGYLLIDVREDKIFGSYIAVDDPAPAGPSPIRRVKPYDQFEIALKLSD
jgi:hypothetical protein